MSRQATKTKQEKAHLSLVEFPVRVETPALNHAEKKINKVTVDYESIAYAEFDRGSLLRVFRKHFRRHVEYLMSDSGGKLNLEDACRQAS